MTKEQNFSTLQQKVTYHSYFLSFAAVALVQICTTRARLTGQPLSIPGPHTGNYIKPLLNPTDRGKNPLRVMGPIESENRPLGEW